MIDEPLQETACLHVLGLLGGDEAAAFERDLARDPDLRELVRSLNDATLALAQSAPSVAPPGDLRRRLLEALGDRSKPAAIPLAPARDRRWPLAVAWAAAAGFAGLAWWQWQQATDARRQAEVARQEGAIFRTSAEQSAAHVAGLETSLSTATSEAQSFREKVSEAEKSLTALGTEKTTLLARVSELENRNLLDQARIAVLGSKLKNRPKAVAVSVWNQQRQDGVVVVENLPVLARGRDYQLWVIDPQVGGPVSAGVFKVDAQGRGRLEFKPAKPIIQAGQFAITEEIEGGVPAPTMNNMVVFGQ
jgi:anti-sigma-K factor RskA